MRTTIALDDALLAEAQRLTGTREKAALKACGACCPHRAERATPARLRQ